MFWQRWSLPVCPSPMFYSFPVLPHRQCCVQDEPIQLLMCLSFSSLSTPLLSVCLSPPLQHHFPQCVYLLPFNTTSLSVFISSLSTPLLSVCISPPLQHHFPQCVYLLPVNTTSLGVFISSPSTPLPSVCLSPPLQHHLCCVYRTSQYKVTMRWLFSYCVSGPSLPSDAELIDLLLWPDYSD